MYGLWNEKDDNGNDDFITLSRPALFLLQKLQSEVSSCWRGTPPPIF